MKRFFFHPYMDMYQSYYEHRFAILFYDMAYKFNRKYRIERMQDFFATDPRKIQTQTSF